MSEETTRLVDRLRRRLRRTVRRLTLGELAFGIALTLGVAGGLWLLSTVLEAELWMAPEARTGVAGVTGVVVLLLFGRFVAPPLLRLAGLLRQPGDEEAARRVGHHFPEIADRFVNLLQLASGTRSGGAQNAPLTDRAVTHLSREVERVEFEKVEDFSRARSVSRLAFVPVAGLLLFLLAAPGAFLDASGRLLAPTAHFQRPAPFQLALAPGAADLVKGDSLAVTVHAEGHGLPSTVTLQVQVQDEEHVEDLTLSPSDSGGTRFRHTFDGVRQSFRYRATAEAAGRPLRTAWHEARVSERPRVQRLQVTLAPPSYSGLADRTLAPGAGDVTALPGTRVTVEARLAGPATQEALLRFADGDTDTLAIEDGTARGHFTLQRDGSYQLALQAAGGVRNADPIRYQLQTTSDAAPTVSFTAPGPETVLTDALRPQLRWQMSDDFGFAQQRLYYRLAERRHGDAMDAFASVDLPVDRPGLLDQEVAYDWLLRQTTDLDLVPGDVVEYYVRVWDNNRVAGYQSARTAMQRLRLPSLAEKYEQLDETQSEVEEQMERLREQSESTRRQFEGLREEIRRKREGDWEDQRQVEQLQEKQQQLQQGAERLSRQIEETARQMQAGQLTSPETQRMYEELRRVAREIHSPELQKALEQLQEAMQEMDMEKMQQALQDFEFNEEQYRERLERTIDLFKKLKAQQKLEEAARRAGELAQEERRLAEETQKLEEQESEDTQKRGTEEAQSQSRETDPQQQQESDDRSAGQQSQSEGDQQQSRQPDGRQRSAEKRERLAEAQERAREKMQQLREELQQLSKDMKDMRGAPKEQLQQLQQRSRQMPQQMQQNSQQLRQGQLQKAQQGQQQMQQQLRRMQQSLSQMQQGMRQKKQQMNMAGLRQALANTLRLSEEQEALRHRTSGLASGSPALREVTRRQNELAEGLRTTSDSLTALAREIPKMTRAVQKETGESLRAMQQATEAMTGRTARQAGAHQKAAMKNLNELALLLSQLLQQMQNQSGQGGGMSAQQMMQQLQQMAGQQQKLNGQLQQMLNDMQGDRLSQGQAARLKQMAQQQKALQQQLQELRRQGADGQALGDLERVAEQMGETIREMQRQRLSRQTLERQQQILSRLLQARQSLQKRGKKEERRGQEADGDYTQERPADAAPQQEAERLRRALIRSLESGYTPDYEQLIKRYFELLQEQRSDGTETPRPD